MIIARSRFIPYIIPYKHISNNIQSYHMIIWVLMLTLNPNLKYTFISHKPIFPNMAIISRLITRMAIWQFVSSFRLWRRSIDVRWDTVVDIIRRLTVWMSDLSTISFAEKHSFISIQSLNKSTHVYAGK
jgi:hypothetical protein